MTTTLPPMSSYRVIIHFEQDRTAFMAHLASEEQRRGLHKDKIYRPHWQEGSHHLHMITDAISPKEAELKARLRLIDYVLERTP